MRAPCLNCPDRYVGCHDHCGAYLSYREAQNAQNARERAEAKSYGYVREAERRKLSKQKYTKGKRYQSIR